MIKNEVEIENFVKTSFQRTIKKLIAVKLSHDCLIVVPRIPYMKRLTSRCFSKFTYHWCISCFIFH